MPLQKPDAQDVIYLLVYKGNHMFHDHLTTPDTATQHM